FEALVARSATGEGGSVRLERAPTEASHPADGPSAADEDEPKPKRHEEKSTVLRWLHPNGVHWGTEESEFDPAAIDQARRWLGLLFGERRYFRLRVHGWEHVPSAPTMVVSNHSGGTLIPDAWGLCFAWYTRFGTRRPIHPAAHEMVLGNRFT